MAETPLLAVRCPQDLLNLIEKEKSLTGRSKTDIVVERLKQSIPSLPVVERNSLPEIPAIYLVFTPDNRLLYIGQTCNLKQRWMSHHRYGQFIEADVNSRVAWFAFDLDNLDSLPSIESELITSLDSEYNGTPSPYQSSRSTRIDLRIPNDLLETIQELASDRFNTPIHHISGKPEITPVIIQLIQLGIGTLSKNNSNSYIDKTPDTYRDNLITSDQLENAIDSLRNELSPLLDAQKELEALLEK